MNLQKAIVVVDDPSEFRKVCEIAEKYGYHGTDREYTYDEEDFKAGLRFTLSSSSFGRSDCIPNLQRDYPDHKCYSYKQFVKMFGGSKATMLQKLTITLKKRLDANMQVLFRAGLIDKCQELTPTGEEALWGVLFEDKIPKLVEAAKEVIKEAEAEK